MNLKSPPGRFRNSPDDSEENLSNQCIFYRKTFQDFALIFTKTIDRVKKKIEEQFYQYREFKKKGSRNKTFRTAYILLLPNALKSPWSLIPLSPNLSPGYPRVPTKWLLRDLLKCFFMVSTMKNQKVLKNALKIFLIMRKR